MHRGVGDFLGWLEQHGSRDDVDLAPPVGRAVMAGLEQSLGAPLPADLRLVLNRFNGGAIPTGTLLRVGGGQHSIESTLKQYAEGPGRRTDVTELPLPFCRTTEGSVLAFDRSAGPIADTWPVVDQFEETGEVRLVHRTFDGWCRMCVQSWNAADFDAPFSLDRYLSQGERHVRIEPDVSAAHVTVAHALKRAGHPERALAAYLCAARCVPALPWCDWEALKLATLLRTPVEAFEAANRLCRPAPAERWRERDTRPARVADLIGQLALRAPDPAPWIRLLDQLLPQSIDGRDRSQVSAVRRALVLGEHLPTTTGDLRAPGGTTELRDRWWSAIRKAYAEGAVRDDDLLLDPTLAPLRAEVDLADIIRVRREF